MVPEEEHLRLIHPHPSTCQLGCAHWRVLDQPDLPRPSFHLRVELTTLAELLGAPCMVSLSTPWLRPWQGQNRARAG